MIQNIVSCAQFERATSTISLKTEGLLHVFLIQWVQEDEKIMAGGTLQRAKSDVLVSGPSRLLDDLELHQIDLPTRICFFKKREEHCKP